VVRTILECGQLLYSYGYLAEVVVEDITIPPLLLRLGLFVTSTTSVIISPDSESRLRQITSCLSYVVWLCCLARFIAVQFHRDT
jgi:hypothetical protein